MPNGAFTTTAEAATKVKSTAKKATPTKAVRRPIKVVREVQKSRAGKIYEYAHGIWTAKCLG
jgi:hypothetical protein